MCCVMGAALGRSRRVGWGEEARLEDHDNYAYGVTTRAGLLPCSRTIAGTGIRPNIGSRDAVVTLRSIGVLAST